MAFVPHAVVEVASRGLVAVPDEEVGGLTIHLGQKVSHYQNYNGKLAMGVLIFLY
jgi:hypothetical protein